ncbi:MAG: hypothetical protein ABIF85_04965 [Nanoarchaeota archaeon]|nr:hypothetical protein [Nanoarchaeota archaeon]MBU4299892.1 hypothetical protein [Nanoarchaeota archaeon]MBU4452329.1 hypothetical protein [Nanoarchaeota archaeon]MCG2724547.1 hypothetical protein [archaeon]
MENYLSKLAIKSEEDARFRYYKPISILDNLPGAHILRTFLGIYETKSLNNAVSLLVSDEPKSSTSNFSLNAAKSVDKYILPC